MANKPKKKRAAKAQAAPRAQVVKIMAPQPRSAALALREQVIIQQPRRAPSRGRGGFPLRRSGIFAGLGAGAKTALMPVKETLQGGGGGVLVGLIDDAIPKLVFADSPVKRAGLALGVTAILSWMVGLPPLVVAGAAGGAARKLYDDLT